MWTEWRRQIPVPSQTWYHKDNEKDMWESGGIDPLNLMSAKEGGDWSVSRLSHICPQGNLSPSSLPHDKEWKGCRLGSRVGLGAVEKSKSCVPARNWTTIHRLMFFWQCIMNWLYRMGINFRRISLRHNLSRKFRKIVKFMSITHSGH